MLKSWNLDNRIFLNYESKWFSGGSEAPCGSFLGFVSKKELCGMCLCEHQLGNIWLYDYIGTACQASTLEFDNIYSLPQREQEQTPQTNILLEYTLLHMWEWSSWGSPNFECESLICHLKCKTIINSIPVCFCRFVLYESANISEM